MVSPYELNELESEVERMVFDEDGEYEYSHLRQDNMKASIQQHMLRGGQAVDVRKWYVRDRPLPLLARARVQIDHHARRCKDGLHLGWYE